MCKVLSFGPVDPIPTLVTCHYSSPKVEEWINYCSAGRAEYGSEIRKAYVVRTALSCFKRVL